MTTWIIDALTKEGQRVLPSYEPPDPLDHRFRKVVADSFTAACEQAVFESIALQKIQRVASGETAVCSDRELDWLIEVGAHPTDVVSIPNPNRLGTKDIYLVAKSTHKVIQDARTKQWAAYTAQPEVASYYQRHS